MVVVADDKCIHAQLLLQHLLHELTCRQCRHGLIKGKNIDIIHPRSPQEFHFLLGGSQQARGIVRSKDRPRVAIKGDEQRACITPPCLIQNLPDETLMAAMDAIEETYGTNDGQCGTDYKFIITPSAPQSLPDRQAADR